MIPYDLDPDPRRVELDARLAEAARRIEEVKVVALNRPRLVAVSLRPTTWSSRHDDACLECQGKFQHVLHRSYEFKFEGKADFVYDVKECGDGNTAYFAVSGDQVSFFVECPTDRSGYGGRVFHLPLKDGSVRPVVGPWSSRAGVMNKLGFTPSVERATLEALLRFDVPVYKVTEYDGEFWFQADAFNYNPTYVKSIERIK